MKWTADNYYMGLETERKVIDSFFHDCEQRIIRRNQSFLGTHFGIGKGEMLDIPLKLLFSSLCSFLKKWATRKFMPVFEWRTIYSLTFPIKMKFSVHPLHLIKQAGIPSRSRDCATCILSEIDFYGFVDCFAEGRYLTVILQSNEGTPYICRFSLGNFKEEVKDKVDEIRTISKRLENQTTAKGE